VKAQRFRATNGATATFAVLSLLACATPAFGDDLLNAPATTGSTADFPQGQTIEDDNLVFTNQRSDDERKSRWMDKYVNYQYGDNADRTLARRVDNLHKAIRANLTDHANRTEVVLESYLVKGYVPDLGAHERVVKSKKTYPALDIPGAKASIVASILMAALMDDPAPANHRYNPTQREYCEATVVARINGVRLEVSAREPVIGTTPVMERVTEKVTMDFVTQLLMLLSS
jgi:hypothetical protein